VGIREVNEAKRVKGYLLVNGVPGQIELIQNHFSGTTYQELMVFLKNTS